MLKDSPSYLVLWRKVQGQRGRDGPEGMA